MPEAVRLIIWDLDDTFWGGTLTEGGIAYKKFNHELVIHLAQRGIMSSICSKNDYSTIKKIMEESGIWEYFVFPSIEWSAKGPRLSSIVRRSQLRPETVMFIDDNQLNLQEAFYYVPGIQISDPKIISDIPLSPQFSGKNDPDLSRLKQYRVLESKQNDISSSADNTEFLRGSNIRVELDYDIMKNIDRAVELINRTNQLNFTKSRLPETSSAGAATLSSLLEGHDIQAALIRVVDRYGDYGHVGIYVLRNTPTAYTLLHFAFSCRILNMGVEQFMYRYLKCPYLEIVGDVLCDIKSSEPVIDWINFVDTNKTIASHSEHELLRRITIRGGCDMLALSHYLNPIAQEICVEAFVHRDGRNVRIDHSIFLSHALDNLNQSEQETLNRVGYVLSDYSSKISEPGDGREAWVLSFWMDGVVTLYQDRETGLKFPFMLPLRHHAQSNLLEVPFTEVAPCLEDNLPMRKAYEYLMTQCSFFGCNTESQFKSTLGQLLSRAAQRIHIFVILCPAVHVSKSGQWMPISAEQNINKWTTEVFCKSENVSLIDPMAHVASRFEMPATKHFNRIVYNRIANAIIAITKAI